MERLTSDDTLEMDDYMHSDDELEDSGLTHSQHKSRRKGNVANGSLHGQPSDAASPAIVDRKLVNATLLKNTGINVLLICLWYSFSISISVYNKWMFSKENLDFHFPLFVTSIHMIVQFVLASTVLYFIPRFRPGADPNVNPQNPTYRHLDNNTEDAEPNDSNPPTKKGPLMTKTFYATRIGPCGTATALDIGLGNFSLRFISLTFFTMCKSSVLAFVLLFAFLFHLESPTWRLCTVILFMTVGVIMMVAGEASFDALGFVLVMTASLCSGFRWSLTQILLLRNPATSNPFSSIFFLTPVMFFALFLLALPIEGPANVVEGVKILAAAKGGFYSFILLLFPGFLAFMMVSAEFALLKRTSVVTLSVCGIFKEVLTISAAGAVFGDELSPINVSGLVVTILSIAAYNVLKYSNVKAAAAEEAHEIVVEESRPEVRKADGQAEASDAVDSTSALLRRDSEQFALAGDDDDDTHDRTPNGVIGMGEFDKPGGTR
jgi:solute carrier family 35 protein C2